MGLGTNSGFNRGAADRWAADRSTFYVEAKPGEDALASILKQVAAATAAGGGVVILPYIGGYQITDTVTVTASNIHIEIYDDVVLTKTTKARAFLFTGQSRSSGRLSNVSFRGIGPKRRVDGNGRNVTGYTYSTSDALYPCVMFRWCDGYEAKNIHGYNGLANCVLGYQSSQGLFENVDGSDAVYDNGVCFVGDPYDPETVWSNTDPSTWAQSVMRKIRAWNCFSGFGATTYIATDCLMEDVKVWKCGNDNVSLPVAGGGVSVEFDNAAGRETRNMRCRVVRPSVTGCYNAGLFVTGRGATVEGEEISGTIAPVNRPNPTTSYGSGILVVGAGSLEERGGNVLSSGTNGVMALAAASNGTDFFPAINFGGKISGAALSGIYGRGVSELTVTPAAEITLGQAGVATGGYGVQVDNTGVAYNQGSGAVDIQPRKIDGAHNRAIEAVYAATVNVSPALIKNCRSGTGISQGAQINVAQVSYASYGPIRNEDANNRTGSIVQFAATVAKGGGTGLVGGDYAAGNAIINNLATTRLTGRADGVLVAIQTYNPPSLAAGASAAIQTMTVTGASLGDRATCTFSLDLAGIDIKAWVSAANTVSYYFTNTNGTNPLDLNSGKVTAIVQKV